MTQPPSDQPPPGGYPPQPPPGGYPPQPPGGYPPQPPPDGYPPQQPYTMSPPAGDPGRTLGIIGLILSFFTALIGMIVSLIALRQSKKAGFKNTPALVGVIIGAIGTVIGIIVAIVVITALARFGQTCAELGPGAHDVNGVTITCP